MICSTEFEGPVKGLWLKVTLTRVKRLLGTGYRVRLIVGEKREGEFFTTIEEAREHYLLQVRVIINQSCGIEEHFNMG